MNESSWILVAQVPLSQNLHQFSERLSSLGINHKIVTDEQRQSVWLENAEHIAIVDELLKQQAPSTPTDPWFDATSHTHTKQSNLQKSKTGGNVFTLFKHYPLVLLGITLSAIGALLVYVLPRIAELLLFPPLHDLSGGQVWRLVTPIFLHFNLMHLVFNSLWLWVFGTRLEPLIGRLNFASLILATGVAGNVAQYFWSASVLFGGMSGVNYGLMGYIWARQKLRPHPLLELPPALFGFMFFFLFLGMTGVLDGLAGGGIANAAHLGGLVIGIALGGLSAITSHKH